MEALVAAGRASPRSHHLSGHWRANARANDYSSSQGYGTGARMDQGRPSQ
ncbi:hypothetical protein NHJ13734_001832 [Beauveria thailandica]